MEREFMTDEMADEQILRLQASPYAEQTNWEVE